MDRVIGIKMCDKRAGIERELASRADQRGGLRQQRNDGGGCASMRERFERVESPGTFVTE